MKNENRFFYWKWSSFFVASYMGTLHLIGVALFIGLIALLDETDAPIKNWELLILLTLFLGIIFTNAIFYLVRMITYPEKPRSAVNENGFGDVLWIRYWGFVLMIMVITLYIDFKIVEYLIARAV